MTRAREACRACGAWNDVCVEVCASCGTRRPGRDDPRQVWFTQFWTYFAG